MAMAAAATTTTTTSTFSPAIQLPRKTHKASTFRVKCATSKTLILDPPPLLQTVTTFAPATVANLGPGYDFLGCAVDSLGDTVTLSVDPKVKPGSVFISSISGSSKLTKDPKANCAGIAAAAAMQMLNIRSVGLSLSLHKGLPLGSGLGSSAASAAAAAVAVNALFGSPLKPLDLVLAGFESEKKVSSEHADNITPAILGGFVLVRSNIPLELLKLEFPDDKDLIFVLVSPEFQAPTKKMRKLVPEEIRTVDHTHNARQAAALVAAVGSGDVRVLGESMGRDVIVEPRRARAIPGMEGVKRAAMRAGAFGCTISGAGPTAVAVIDVEEKGREIGEIMVEAFWEEGSLRARATVARLDRRGARVIESSEH